MLNLYIPVSSKRYGSRQLFPCACEHVGIPNAPRSVFVCVNVQCSCVSTCSMCVYYVSVNRSIPISHRRLYRTKSTSGVGFSASGKSSLLLYENKALQPKLFFVISFASGVQLLFWTYLSYSAWTDYARLPGQDVKDLVEKRTGFRSFRWRVGLSLLALSAGVLLALMANMYPLRTVTRVLFESKQNAIQLFTCSPTGAERSIRTIPANIVSIGGRRSAGSYLSLKVQGHSLHFLLDTKGNFPQPRVFDRLINSK